MTRFLKVSRVEAGGGLRVKVRGGGLRKRCTVCGRVESSGGCGCLGRFVAHEMVRESRSGPHMEEHTIWTSYLVGEERTEVNSQPLGGTRQQSELQTPFGGCQ